MRVSSRRCADGLDHVEAAAVAEPQVDHRIFRRLGLGLGDALGHRSRPSRRVKPRVSMARASRLRKGPSSSTISSERSAPIYSASSAVGAGWSVSILSVIFAGFLQLISLFAVCFTSPRSTTRGKVISPAWRPSAARGHSTSTRAPGAVLPRLLEGERGAGAFEQRLRR